MAKRFSPARLDRLLAERGLNHSELARRTGSYSWMIGRYRRGVTTPDIATVCRIVEAVGGGVTFDDLLEDVDAA